MQSVPPPDPGGEAARLLHALRHALADPLSAAALKLDLVERRLLGPSGADPAWLLERVRALQNDVSATTRLLALLPRLAAIADERPEDSSLDEVSSSAGVRLGAAKGAVPRLMLRRDSLADAIRSVAAFLAGDDGAAAPAAHAALESGRVSLVLEGTRAASEDPSARLLDLPHGNAGAEALFVARAAAVTDGGRLALAGKGGHLVATFSWPVPPAGGAGKSAA
jgi:hypothetical protein